MVIELILVILGFIILIKGADYFVDGSSSIARHFNLSKILIGLTIVAFGTGLPEFVISIKSMIGGNSDVVLGNVIGSNILNILLAIGCASIIVPMKVKSITIKRQIPLAIMMTLMFSILISDNLFSKTTNFISRQDGFILILFFIGFIYYLLTVMRNKIDDDEEIDAKYPMKKAFLALILGLILVIISSDLILNNILSIANRLNLSQKFISTTVIALGTGVTEIITSIVAIRKKEHDILIGNVIGTNLFNLGIVVGLPAVIFGGINAVSFSYIDIFMLIFSSVILLLFSKNDGKIDRKEGIIMMIAFIYYYIYLFKEMI